MFQIIPKLLLFHVAFYASFLFASHPDLRYGELGIQYRRSGDWYYVDDYYQIRDREAYVLCKELSPDSTFVSFYTTVLNYNVNTVGIRCSYMDDDLDECFVSDVYRYDRVINITCLDESGLSEGSAGRLPSDNRVLVRYRIRNTKYGWSHLCSADNPDFGVTEANAYCQDLSYTRAKPGNEITIINVGESLSICAVENFRCSSNDGFTSCYSEEKRNSNPIRNDDIIAVECEMDTTTSSIGAAPTNTFITTTTSTTTTAPTIPTTNPNPTPIPTTNPTNIFTTTAPTIPTTNPTPTQTNPTPTQTNPTPTTTTNPTQTTPITTTTPTITTNPIPTTMTATTTVPTTPVVTTPALTINARSSDTTSLSPTSSNSNTNENIRQTLSTTLPQINTDPTQTIVQHTTNSSEVLAHSGEMSIITIGSLTVATILSIISTATILMFIFVKKMMKKMEKKRIEDKADVSVESGVHVKKISEHYKIPPTLQHDQIQLNTQHLIVSRPLSSLSEGKGCYDSIQGYCDVTNTHDQLEYYESPRTNESVTQTPEGEVIYQNISDIALTTETDYDTLAAGDLYNNLECLPQYKESVYQNNNCL